MWRLDGGNQIVKFRNPTLMGYETAIRGSATSGVRFQMRLAGSLLLVCLATVGSASAQSPQSVPILQLNQPVTANLKDGESHTYTLHADAGMLVRVLVMQQGVDVSVEALDLRRARLARSEDSFGRIGSQPLAFVAESADGYLIVVAARKGELGGSYEIRYLDARTVTVEDRRRMAANGHVTAGNAYRSRVSPDRVRAGQVEYEKALTIFKEISDKAGQATSLQYIARLYEDQGDYRRAIENYSAALALWREVPDRRGEAYTMSSIGTMNLYLGNLDLAYTSFERAGEIYREVRNREGEGLCLQEIGNIYRQQGELARGLQYLRQALDVFREVGAKQRMLYVLSNMGVAYHDLGDLDQAATYLNQALVIGHELQQRHGTALAFINLGDIYAEKGETRQALSFYQQALPLCLDVGDENCSGRSFRRLASVNASLGETQTALDFYAKSAAIYRRKERPVELARMLNSAGSLYSLLGDQKRALVLFDEALAVSRKTLSRQDEATTLSNLAGLYADEGDTPKARELYLQALTISREIRNRLNEATNLNRLGFLSHSEGNRPEAIRLFEEALAINKELGTRYNGALALNNLGIVQDAAGNTKLALDYFTRALSVFREIENKNGEAMMLYRVAAVQKKLGQIDRARHEIAAALEIVETIRGKIASTDLRSSYFSTVQQYLDLHIDLLMDEHRAHPGEDFNFKALQVSERARARSLLDLLQEANADVRQGVDRNLLVREKELLELINGKAAQQTLAFSDPRKAELAKSLGKEIAHLSDEFESLQAAIRQSNLRYADLVHAQPLRLAEVQKSLDPETVLIEIKLGDERSYLWLVSGTKLESFELAPRVEIETQARALYELLTERNRGAKGETPAQKRARVLTAEQQLKAVSARLSQTLFGSLASAITNKRLVIVADGALQYVPFGALVNADQIVSLPSIAVLAQLRRQDIGRQVPEKSVAVFADPVFEADDPRLARASRPGHGTQSGSVAQSLPDFDFGLSARGLPRLFASRNEAKAILALAPASSGYGAFDFDASRERAMEAELKHYRVLHFATHGLLNTSRPQLSGVVLSLYDSRGNERDGFLRLNQIYNLNLGSELVVLSACSTALGQDVKGEGLIGLTRGFMYAGARQVIASLWKVDDEATAELMTIFYRNLLREKMSAPKALRAAQVELQSQARWRSPYYWGAFVLQGDWR